MKFGITGRAGVEVRTRRLLTEYLQLAQSFDETTGSRSIIVPRMPGIDEDMRAWSFFMILRHNTIVNHAISAQVKRLALDEPESRKKFDPKTDVMPAAGGGIEQIALFKTSVLSHLEMVRPLGILRKTATARHPVFGTFDAHQWHCMFAFHLQLHLRQAAFVKKIAMGKK